MFPRISGYIISNPMGQKRSFTIIGRFDDTGETVINYIDVNGSDVHFEILRHWGEVNQLTPHYEILAVFLGELTPAVTPQTLKTYVEQHFPHIVKQEEDKRLSKQ